MPDALNNAITPFQIKGGGLQSTEKPGHRNDTTKLGEACNDFEALFVKYMMQQMRKTVPEDGLFGRSQAEKIYTGMLDDEVAKSVSYGRGLGLARAMYEQMATMQSNETKKK